MIMTLVVMTYCLIVIQSINIEWLLDIKIKQEGKTLSEKVESRGDRLYKYVESNWRETRGGGKSGDGTSHQVLKDFENIISIWLFWVTVSEVVILNYIHQVMVIFQGYSPQDGLDELCLGIPHRPPHLPPQHRLPGRLLQHHLH